MGYMTFMSFLVSCATFIVTYITKRNNRPTLQMVRLFL